jgi:hypothetical protein
MLTLTLNSNEPPDAPVRATIGFITAGLEVEASAQKQIYLEKVRWCQYREDVTRLWDVALMWWSSSVAMFVRAHSIQKIDLQYLLIRHLGSGTLPRGGWSELWQIHFGAHNNPLCVVYHMCIYLSVPHYKKLYGLCIRTYLCTPHKWPHTCCVAY